MTKALLVVISVLIFGCGPGDAVSSGQAPTASVKVAPVAAKIERPKTWGRLAVWSGSGIKNTEPFTVSAPWKFEWSSKADTGMFSATAKGRGVYELLANEVVTGVAGEATTVYKGGELHIEVNAIGAWRASVLVQADWFVAEDCKAFAAVPPNPYLFDDSPVQLSPSSERERAEKLELECVKAIAFRAKDHGAWTRYDQAMALTHRQRSANDIEDMKRAGLPAEAVLLWLAQYGVYLDAAIATKEAAAKVAK